MKFSALYIPTPGFNICLISPFEARACRDYILLCIENYLQEYTESTINIIQVLKVIGVNYWSWTIFQKSTTILYKKYNFIWKNDK